MLLRVPPVTMTFYWTTTERQAATALSEYLAERPAALQRLRDELAAEGLDPDAVLDATPGSLTPLWRWVATRIMGMEDVPAPVPRDAPGPPWWPSWARYSSELRRSTPDEVVALLDGLVSFLAEVVTAHAPDADWKVCHHRVKRYRFQNHPVLMSPVTDSDICPPGLVAVVANRLRRGMDPLREDEFTDCAAAVTTRLRGESEPVPVAEEEPLVEVGEEDGVFAVGPHEETAHEHSRKVARMVEDLAAQPGVDSAFREDREMLLVTAPDWDAEQLQRLVTDWLRVKLPAER